VRPERSVNRALIVSGGQLVRSAYREGISSPGEIGVGLDTSVSTESPALESLRKAVDRWVRECETGTASVICADRGYDYARLLGLSPDLVVGDLDSISPAGRSAARDLGGRLEIHPSKKDATDTEIAVEHALAMDASQILMLGALGGRVDHELANLMLLVRIAMLGRQAEAFDNVCRVLAVAADSKPAVARIAASPGDLLTIIPVSCECRGVSLKGLEYPLSKATLPIGTSLGVSNVFAADEATVSLENGAMLVIVTFASAKGPEVLKTIKQSGC
jgi:thiamine pyrophosphokinase